MVQHNQHRLSLCLIALFICSPAVVSARRGAEVDTPRQFWAGRPRPKPLRRCKKRLARQAERDAAEIALIRGDYQVWSQKCPAQRFVGECPAEPCRTCGASGRDEALAKGRRSSRSKIRPVYPSVQASAYLGCFNDTVPPSSLTEIQNLYDRWGQEYCRSRNGASDPLTTFTQCSFDDIEPLSLDLCQSNCAQTYFGYKYFAVQDSGFCFCGAPSASDTPPGYGNAPDLYGAGTCTDDCFGDSSEVCGGSYANSIYTIDYGDNPSINPSKEYLDEFFFEDSNCPRVSYQQWVGCFNDNVTQSLNTRWGIPQCTPEEFPLSDPTDSSICDYSSGSSLGASMSLEYCQLRCATSTISTQKGRFEYFAVQDGNQCFCGFPENVGGNAPDLFGASDACYTFCEGSSSQTCGGAFVNNIYTINYDGADNANFVGVTCNGP